MSKYGDDFIENIILIDKKEKLLGKITVWLRTRKLWNECMKDIGEEQLIVKDT